MRRVRDTGGHLRPKAHLCMTLPDFQLGQDFQKDFAPGAEIGQPAAVIPSSYEHQSEGLLNHLSLATSGLPHRQALEIAIFIQGSSSRDSDMHFVMYYI